MASPQAYRPLLYCWPQQTCCLQCFMQTGLVSPVDPTLNLTRNALMPRSLRTRTTCRGTGGGGRTRGRCRPTSRACSNSRVSCSRRRWRPSCSPPSCSTSRCRTAPVRLSGSVSVLTLPDAETLMSTSVTTITLLFPLRSTCKPNPSHLAVRSQTEHESTWVWRSVKICTASPAAQ